ncbi:MAG TPA: glycoside hydrolase family 3 N-terminal domain-containing protein [Candidatus Kapabacteria bacterium]|nr:glycoside hydrolase family 3 N-terminal domain-containing protein [Candidatus Kapabacteria bacterium]
MYKLLIFIMIIIIFLNSCSDNNPVNTPEGLDLEQKIGQMLIIGFRGIDIQSNDPIVKDLEARNIGGVVLFDKDVALNSTKRNIESPEQVKHLISTLTSYSNTKLLVCVDQEGGKVARLKQQYGFPYNVSQQYLGDLDNIDTSKFYANRTANLLKNLGFNVNFAPVVDLNINPDNPVIGKIERSFSKSPDIVVKHSQILISELQQQGVLSTLKHFPGHGSSNSDSHLGLTDISNTWQSIELEPYRRLINSNFNGMVMTAHIFNSYLDPEYPATLSHKIITGILREQLHYNGVVVSDDMNMGAITQQYGLERAIELSINAGVDILIFANNLVYDENIARKAIDIILDLVRQGKISKERIEESYQRIMKLKSTL